MKPKKNLTPETRSWITLANEKYLIPALLVLTILFYAGGLDGDVLNFDDNEYFEKYPEVTGFEFSKIPVFFKTYYVIMYQPLPVLSLAIQQSFGPKSTFPFHAFNLLFHLMNILLVYRLSIKLLPGRTYAFFTALLFAIHPMATEAVTWISARSSVMYAFFYLLSFHQYILYHEKNQSLKNYLLAFTFFVFSLLCKVQAITLPVVFLVFDFLKSRNLFSVKNLLEKIPFLAGSIIMGLVALADSETLKNITAGMLEQYNIPETLFLISWSVAFYLLKFFIPWNLCSIYVFPPVEDGLLPFNYYLAPLLLLGIGWFLYKNRTNKLLITGMAFFLVSIAVNIQVIPSRLFITADRYAYLPSIGISIALCAWVYQKGKEDFYGLQKIQGILFSLFGILLAVFMFTTRERNKVWANDLVLMNDIIEKNPKVPYLYRAYGTRGNYYMAQKMLDKAMLDFNESIAMYPQDSRTWINRGRAFVVLGNYPSAEQDLDSAIARNPDFVLGYSVRAIIRFNLNKPEAALADCNAGIKTDSTYFDLYNTRSAVLFSLKDYENCEKDLNKVIALNPKFGDGYKNRGQLYQTLNRKEEACRDLDIAQKLGARDAYAIWNNYCR